jgi:peptide/nickel transport system permease protein
LLLHVKGYTVVRHPVSLARTYTVDESAVFPVRFFIRSWEYKILGLIPTKLHLIGPEDPEAPMFLLGTDRIGRDVLSRIIFGTRISMSIGLVGVLMSLSLGILLGGISGYYGGFADTMIQRLIEFLRSMPTIPLWLGLSAALPVDWPPLRVYFGITVILSLIGWTGLARVVRGRFLSLREEDFVLAARLTGSGELRIVLRHMVPAFMSHIIASVTLAIPRMILSETSLSFLGLGLRPPAISWGVLLREAQNVRSVATAPWLLLPGIAVVIAVLAINFLGDGIRDAADPYSR